MYHPLDYSSRQFRLLHLDPDAGNGQISASLRTAQVPPPRKLVDRVEILRDKLKLLEQQKGVLERRNGAQDTQLEVYQARLHACQSTVQEKNGDFQPAYTTEEETTNVAAKTKPGLSHYAQRVDSSKEENNEPPATYSKERNYLPSAPKETDTTSVKYEAISYCWGYPNTKTKIIINGTPFYAPLTAVEVLRNFCLADRSRVLWLDAVYQNQDDPEERAQQVALMGDIYTNALATLIWLGPSSNKAETADAILLCRTIAQKLSGKRGLHDRRDFDELVAVCPTVVAPHNYDLHLLDVIFDRRWFGRLWVWQEAALSCCCVCYIGNYSLPWEYVMLTAFWWIKVGLNYNTLPSVNLPKEAAESNMQFPSTILMESCNTSPQEPYQGAGLSRIVQQSRHCQATDPKYKIFGLLGMTTWSRLGHAFPSGIQPDYHRSVRNCMRNATRVMIQEDQSLDVLSDELLYAKRDPKWGNEPWPSWTPV